MIVAALADRNALEQLVAAVERLTELQDVAFAEPLERRRVGNPQESWRVESLTRGQCDARLVEEPLLEPGAIYVSSMKAFAPA